MTGLIEDPLDPTRYIISSAAEAHYGLQTGPGTLTNVHPASRCAGEACVIHSPSEHHMSSWRLNWRDDRGLMERLCEHGVGHPDPDDLAFHVRHGRTSMGVHGCDGCCFRE